MPLMRVGTQLIFYAHVPKCAGTSVERYLEARFGKLAFCDTAHLKQAHPWSRTSPQHIDLKALSRLFPQGFIDESFAIVRHPLTRIVSAWHFQLEVEKTIPAGVEFLEWLSGLAEDWETRPYAFDNHMRPMSDFIPADAQIFYLEHGLDAIIPWLDRVTGTRMDPRFIETANQRSKKKSKKVAKLEPCSQALELITDLYKEDFERFGYKLDDKMPLSPAPELSQEDRIERDAARAKAERPGAQLVSKIRRKLNG
ncbi:hypothetical protein RSK20926_01212 [Roseobacter sp. SK209-2-6]|uniref:sulfotransferase family protein n=1 Tax=Roseobacter sp. SK209-2-6 TaxID=388739 RepID=UPI0000F3F4B1|nr:sulfotransferase family protein [Roseobacter sp. SK209-2-6]EBA14571.1 hypothetical protein RSK20926_01212 [Roseobacter sp. SK209-2-6]